MSFDINIFINRKEENNDYFFDNKNIISNNIVKEQTIKKFENELFKIEESIFKINNNDIDFYKKDLIKIPDFEEDNIKMMIYCFLILRSYGFNYEEYSYDFNLTNKSKLIIDLYNQFDKNKDRESLENFLDDIYRYCYVINKYRNSQTDDYIEEEGKRMLFLNNEQEKDIRREIFDKFI